eukprot:CAMPEP_0197232302 /NCGR_PEP_ID=MMETSP1429-20130617/152_1 /TAXON_ID=49237 /ORGANISM="Chaetoceros  sp., Strain UNC1202" /LENGTH=1842 /DNA_ID=CAMNT_0042690279 /DNA_START=1 /DNA_END=5529 /DNA_ORIENTATION=-
MDKSNGIELWNRIKTHCKKDSRSPIDLKRREAEFMNIEMAKHENIWQFRTRFENEYEELVASNMPQWVQKDIFVHFIGATRDPTFDTVYENFRDFGHHGTWSCLDLRSLADRLDSYAKDRNRRRQLFGIPKEKKEDQQKEKHKKQKDKEKTKEKAPKWERNKPLNPFDEDSREPSKPREPKQKSKIQKEMDACIEKGEMTLDMCKKYEAQYPYGCTYHSGHPSHSLAECKVFMGRLNAFKKKQSSGTETKPKAKRMMFADLIEDPENSENESDNNSNDEINDYSFTHHSTLITRDEINNRKTTPICTPCKLETPTTPKVQTQASREIQTKQKAETKISARCNYTTPTTKTTLANAMSTMIIDSGATMHMTGLKHIFTNIFQWDDPLHRQRTVILGDGTTTLNIAGVGTIDIEIGGKRVHLDNVLYVPSLKDTLFSIKEHTKHKGCGFHAEERAILTFPTFTVDVECNDEYTVDISHPTTTSKIQFRSEDFVRMSAKRTSNINLAPHHLKDYIPPDSPHIQQYTTAVKIKKLLPSIPTPTRATMGSIGYDIASTQNVTVKAGTQACIGTGIKMEIPEGTYGRIAPRSGLAAKHRISIEAGVIDNDYRGEIKVLFNNQGEQDIHVEVGDNIAQIIFEQANKPLMMVTEETTQTERQEKGFGSTDNPTQNRIETIRTPNQIIVMDRKAGFKSMRAFDAPHIITPDTEEQQEDSRPANAIPYSEDELEEEADFLYGDQDTPTTGPSPQSDSSPCITPVDRVNSALPSMIAMTRDELRHAFGYRDIEKVTANIRTIAKPTVHISDPKPDPFEDVGPIATVDKKRSNNTPLPRPQMFGDTFHMDIGYGTGKAIGGVSHCLFLVDRATRKKYIYPLKNLTTSLMRALRKFLRDIRITPRRILADFDEKLIKGQVEEYLVDRKIEVSGAPSGRQNQNGLAESNWRTVVRMARGYLTKALLPSKFWYFAVRRAVEASNYFPCKANGTITTPHELAHGIKPDYRTLIPQFGVAYIRRKKDANINRGTFHSRSLKCIVVGQCQNSDSLIFYHPPSKQVLTSGDYNFDNKLPSGPQFHLHYDGGIDYKLHEPGIARHRQLSHELEASVYAKHPESSKYEEAKILDIPINEDEEPYTVQFIETREIVQIQSQDILEDNPQTPITDDPEPSQPPAIPGIDWIKNGAKCIIYTSAMNQPKQGTLRQTPANEWEFIPGRPNSKKPQKAITLENFTESARSMIANRKLFQGWAHRFSDIIHARQATALSNVIAAKIHAKHISAKGLSTMDTPTLLQHAKMNNTDKEIWTSAYREEYDGLANLPAWEVIDESEYNRIKHLVGSILPTMAVSTIKSDENGNPVRAKYRIVALGNLDPHEWSKSECYAPVMSLFELRYMVALAARHKCIPKNGDVKQAFCQAILPDTEKYVLRPPAGCPITPPKSYWILKRTLYGLKRSPKHWFVKCKALLESIGMTQCPNTPCLFKGTLIKEKPPLYLGLYVDDFIYFSKSPEVEKHFETEFGDKTSVDFMGPATHFLGIKIQHKKDQDGHVEIRLSQEAFAEQLIQSTGLDGPEVSSKPTPYRSGHPVDAVRHREMTDDQRMPLIRKMRSLIGSLLWLSQATRPDLATITNMLAKYMGKPSPGHIDATKHVIRYLKGTKDLGIKFSSRHNESLSSYLKFQTNPRHIQALTDANWGPQDQSVPKTHEKIAQFKSRSISGYVIMLGGPLHWESKRQKITARSTAESEIYATDECVKRLTQIRNISADMGFEDLIMPDTIPIYNDNNACVQWSASMTTRGLRHIQMRENAVREEHAKGHIKCIHIKGDINISDMFTKEDKDTKHFISIRDQIMAKPLDLKIST